MSRSPVMSLRVTNGQKLETCGFGNPLFCILEIESSTDEPEARGDPANKRDRSW
ncbi:MAG: hypothetical protein NT172_19095 [Planctomycetota bacterium]|nr:hypothetical protein [Planctomycetota bacterium]